MDILANLGFTDLRGITNDESELGDERIDLGDVHDLPYEDASFHHLYSKETLEHLISPYLALSEMNRVLKIDGEYCHLISCGLEKQRELYHVSCFPDWLWADLFKKTGFSVDYIYQTQATEIGFVGRKVSELPLEGTGKLSYDLNAYMNGIRRFNITL